MKHYYFNITSTKHTTKGGVVLTASIYTVAGLKIKKVGETSWNMVSSRGAETEIYSYLIDNLIVSDKNFDIEMDYYTSRKAKVIIQSL